MLSALGLLAVLIGISFFGVYFLGDTVTYMQFGSMGGPLTTFIQHDGLWPPLFALIFNVVQRVPLDRYLLSSLWVVSLLTPFLAGITHLLTRFTSEKKQAFVLAVLTITGPMTLLMQSHISEPLMLVLWVATLIATVNFWKTSSEKWLLVWLVAAALLPMSRWLGAMVVLWLSGCLLLKLGWDIKLKKKLDYSPWLLLLILAMVWMPTAFYLFRTKVLIGSFFPVRDVQLADNIFALAKEFGFSILSGAGVSMVVAFLYGLHVSTVKKFGHIQKLALFATLGSAAVYLAGLFYSELSYLVVPHIPLRFIAVSFPFLLVSAFMGGTLIRSSFVKKIPSKLLAAVQIVAMSVACLLIVLATRDAILRFTKERADFTTTMSYVGWTADVAQFCDADTKTYVIFHDHTRNWGTRSYAYYCRHAIAVTQPQQLVVEKDARVISAYGIESDGLEKEAEFVLNDFTTRLYRATENTTVDVEKLFALRGVFE